MVSYKKINFHFSQNRVTYLSTSNSLGGGIQIIKHILHAQGQYLTGDTKHWKTTLHGHEVIGLLNTIYDGLEIQGLNRSEINDFGLNTILFLELLSCDNALSNRARMRDYCNIFSWSFYLGLTDLELQKPRLG